MSRSFRRIICFVLSVTVSSLAFAHGRWESQAIIARDGESWALSVSLSPSLALRLLPAAEREGGLDGRRFHTLVEPFKAQVDSVADLRDANGRPLIRSAVDVRLIDDHEVRFTLIYTGTPAELRLPYLTDCPREAFCDVTLGVSPKDVRRTVRSPRATLSLPEAF